MSLIVLHGISLPPGVFHMPWIEALFTGRLEPGLDARFGALDGVTVSSHLLLRRDGECVQFVPLDRRAWHAGRSRFEGRSECNDFSIGIELEGTDTTPYTGAQYQRLIEAIQAIRGTWPGIEAERVVSHAHVAPERKTDPGPAFDWARLYAGLSRGAANSAPGRAG